MLDNRKRKYMLATFTVEDRPSGWFFKNSYCEDDWHGPYSSETSVSLMIARHLKRELLKRDRLSDQPPRSAAPISRHRLIFVAPRYPPRGATFFCP